MDKYLCPSQPASEPDTEHESAEAHPQAVTGNGTEPQPSGPSNADLLQAIKDTHASTINQLDTIKIEISHIRQDVQNLRERTTEVESHFSTLEDTVRPLPAELSRLARQVAEVNAKNDDLENRFRRNNLHLIGLPEQAEGQAPERFMEDWLRETLGAEVFSPMPVVERAHRVPTSPLPPEANARPLILRLPNYRDRDAALSAACKNGQLMYDGSTVSLFLDYSTVVQKQRASFVGVKRRLHTLGYTFSILFPAKLRVIDGESSHFFNTPGDADKWLGGCRQRDAPHNDPHE